jgi:hypothetical protein
METQPLGFRIPWGGMQALLLLEGGQGLPATASLDAEDKQP